MDVKSLAKSKRAHSQHHSKKHHPKSTTVKAPTPGPGGSSTTNKPSGKGVGVKPHQSQSSKTALPSNRDRYEEDYDSDSNDQSQSTTTPGTDVFVLKSKGADYKYMLSEAKLQSATNISSGSFPSFDDVYSDFNEGFGPLLSARGESFLAWPGDDNFIVEDKATATHEASFLSLNLRLLAEQLEKTDLSRRLFIEPDLVLEDLVLQSSDELRTADEESDHVQPAYQSQETEINTSELICDYPNKDDIKDKEGQQEETAFKMESASVLHSQGDSDSLKSNAVAIDFDDDIDDLLKNTAPSILHRNLSIQPARHQPSVKHPGFSTQTSKMSNFDDDLDDLLGDSCTNNVGEIPSGNSAPVQSSKPGHDLSKPASNFDKELDDLLKETSTKAGFTQLSYAQSSSSHPVSKSKLSDDFDALFDKS